MDVDALCVILYTSQDSAQIADAQNKLRDHEKIHLCLYYLDTPDRPYTLIFASSTLLKLATEHSLELAVSLDIRHHIVNCLWTRGPDLQHIVIQPLIQLLCRLTKSSWFDDAKFEGVVEESRSFLGLPTPQHRAIGLRILNQLVSEMNQVDSGLPPSTLHLKVVCSFRDKSLVRIFEISLRYLQCYNNDAAEIQELALSLALRCLSFDFDGTTIDESSDEFGSVQVSSSWRSALEPSSTLQIFFDYYAITNPPISKTALECLVRLASVKQSIFPTDAARSKYLSDLMTGTKKILESGQGLVEHDNYHAFCRLLGNFGVNYQLQELVSVEGYSDWIELLAQFTSTSLQNWQWARSSVYYILGLWSRLVAYVPYLLGDAPSLLDQFVPKITQDFLTSRFESVQSKTSNAYIIKVVEPILQSYTERAQVPTNDGIELSIIEAKLTWMVHMIATILKISAQPQQITVELSACVSWLIKVTYGGLHSQRNGELSKQRLDREILTFFQNFRKSYVGDQDIQSSKLLYARLTDLLGLGDHLDLLSVIVSKIATNLKCNTESKEVIEHTLTLFKELASDHMTRELLLELDTVKLIVSNDTRDHFPFLEECCSRSRTTFYYTIGCLIFMEDSHVKFKSLMKPLLKVFIYLESLPDTMSRSDKVKYSLIGLVRDLRGIAKATNSCRTYRLLFDWLYPERMPLLLRGISHWADTPEVMAPFLKFMAEFVLNRSQLGHLAPPLPMEFCYFKT